MYFMVSGTVIRASSQMWKKLSTVVTGSEDDGRMSQYFNALASEFLERYPYYADERHIFDFSLVFLG